jgi:Glycosyl transferases group 1
MDATATITIFTELGAWSASTRYRVLQHLPRLREQLSSVEVSLPRDSVARPPGRTGQVRYFGTHALRYAERAAEVRRIMGRAEAVLVQRGLYAMGPGVIAKPVESFPGRLVLDLDDAVFRVSPSLASKGPLARWLYGAQQTRRLLARADALVVSTPALAEMLPDRTPTPTILPTVPDPDSYSTVVHLDTAPVVVGWAGTVGGLGYLDPLKPVFERLEREAIARLRVVSSAPWTGPSEFQKWSLAEEHAVFGGFDIGIMPLPDSDYTRAKAGFKLLQYMASGLPVIASPVGVNRALVDDSGGGLLADTPSDWENALRVLAGDRELRARLGASGRAFVERYADLDHQAAVLARTLCPSDAAIPCA